MLKLCIFICAFVTLSSASTYVYSGPTPSEWATINATYVDSGKQAESTLNGILSTVYAVNQAMPWKMQPIMNQAAQDSAVFYYPMRSAIDGKLLKPSNAYTVYLALQTNWKKMAANLKVFIQQVPTVQSAVENYLYYGDNTICTHLKTICDILKCDKSQYLTPPTLPYVY